MALRNPLVLISGNLQELPAGDTVAGASGTRTTGFATVDFGAFPGSTSASVVVSGQSLIKATNTPTATVGADDSTATHSISDHRNALLFFSVAVGTPVVGSGFSIYARSIHKMQGQFKVQWAW